MRQFCLIGTTLLFGCHYGDHTSSSSSADAPAQSWTHAEHTPSASLDHIEVSVEDTLPPAVPSNPESNEIWVLSLPEALSIALENSEVVRSLRSSTRGDSVGSLGASDGRNVVVPQFGPEVTRVGSTIYDPAISETGIESALAAFDTSLEVSMFWVQEDKPIQSFQGIIPRPGQIDRAFFSSSLTKLLATGAEAQLALNNDYLFVPFSRDPSTPGLRDVAQYTPNLEFSLRQPLLRGAGVAVNRAPIVIARLRSDQTLWDFKLAMLALVRSVEEAYWNLYAAHVALRSIEEVLPMASETVRIQQSRLEFQTAIPADVGQAKVQFARFRQQRTAALEAVLDREAVLRNLLGLPPSDGRRIVPSDSPLEAPVQIDWTSTLSTALENRPDVLRQRIQVRVRELQMLITHNALRPQLDVEGLWRINGLGQELDDAVDLLTDNRFTDWSLGVSFQYPLGNRQASSAFQAAELLRQRELALLRETAHATAHGLSRNIRRLDSLYQQYQSARERLAASSQWIQGSRLRFENPPSRRVAGQEFGAGQDSLVLTLDVYLRSLQAWSNASIDTSRLIADYNVELARLEEAKGTLLATNNIALQEDPCASVRYSYVRLERNVELEVLVPIEEPAAETEASGRGARTAPEPAVAPPSVEPSEPRSASGHGPAS